MTKDILAEKSNTCAECGATLVRDAQHGETVCPSCGLVASEAEIDFGPDWRSFDGDKSGVRVGAPRTELLHDYGLSTPFSRGTRDAHGRRIPNKRHYELARMRRLHTRATFRSGADRNIARAIAYVQGIADRLSLPQPITEQAVRIYRQATAADLIRGRSIDAMAAAALYAASRLAGYPRNPDELAEASGVDRRTLLRCHRVLVHDLRLRPTSPHATDFLARLASDLQLPPAVEAAARQLIRDADARGATSGRSPTGLAASAIYVASHEHGHPRTQKRVSEVSGVTEVTIRNRSRELVRVLGLGATSLN
ncbi:MAG TPA: TFIIB-type zinc ribbon-containing protein [Candidatus Thermoplasmatota archaeon]|nr:TFIIB-type zinc ribbon-containing protein [Candidatus Thermoplasmatota archaeon]